MVIGIYSTCHGGKDIMGCEQCVCRWKRAGREKQVTVSMTLSMLSKGPNMASKPASGKTGRAAHGRYGYGYGYKHQHHIISISGWGGYRH